MMNKREVPLIHPGEILLEEWLKPLGISQYALAKAIANAALPPIPPCASPPISAPTVKAGLTCKATTMPNRPVL